MLRLIFVIFIFNATELYGNTLSTNTAAPNQSVAPDPSNPFRLQMPQNTPDLSNTNSYKIIQQNTDGTVRIQDLQNKTYDLSAAESQIAVQNQNAAALQAEEAKREKEARNEQLASMFAMMAAQSALQSASDAITSALTKNSADHMGDFPNIPPPTWRQWAS